MRGSQVLSNPITIVINEKGSDHIFDGRYIDVGKGGLLQWRCKDKFRRLSALWGASGISPQGQVSHWSVLVGRSN